MSAKDTIQRALVLREYSSEIDKLYADADKMPPYTIGRIFEDKVYFNIQDAKAALNFLLKAVFDATKWHNI